MITLYENSEHPVTEISWTENGILLDLTQGYSFEVKVVGPYKSLTKTANIQAYRDKRPNLVVTWDTTDISSLPLGLYVFQLTATGPGSRERIYQESLSIEARV